jgi:hypothetical protein
MKKFAFSLALTFLAVFIFAQTAADYDKILKGDLSAFVGYWVNGDNWRVFLRSDGTFDFDDQPAVNFSKDSNGAYVWTIPNVDPDSGYPLTLHVGLLPVGVPYYYSIKTDTTRVRLYIAVQEGPGSPNAFYYKESRFPATHTTTEILRLRTDQNLSSETVTVIKKGARVLVREWGNDVTIDGKSAKWALVYTADGFRGWCYSGYLKEI